MSLYRSTGFVFAMILLASLAWLVSVPDYSVKTQRLAQVEARLSALCMETFSDDPDAEKPRFTSLNQVMSGLRDGAVLAGMQYRYHAETDKLGARLNPKDLADKAMYDRFNKIKHAFRESAAEADLVQFERDLLRRPTAVHYAMAVTENGALKGMVYSKLEITPERNWRFPFIIAGASFLLVHVILVTWQSRKNRLAYWLVLGASITVLLFWPADSDMSFSAESMQLIENQAHVLSQLAPDPQAVFSRFQEDNRLSEFLTPGVTPETAGPVFPFWFRFLGPILALCVFALFDSGRMERFFSALRQHSIAYAYIAPAMTGMIILVLIPLIYGVILAFMQVKEDAWEFVGIQNFIAILSDLQVTRPDNFYFTLAVTILWTVSNVFLHVAIGLTLALILNRPTLRFKRFYRVLLILPWAIPNYITALIWKGMFHRQFGAINALLEFLGFEALSWFNHFGTAFVANLMTNVWLGFPFMMVVSLGALQSIPGELYEAASMDGASRKQQFLHITVPLLKSALFPAVILGTIWTFNMFNIIYLVSGGAPEGSTDILIVDAYRWAFQKYNYGYAAAYSLVIFIVLFTYSAITNRITRATEGAFD